MKYFFWRFFFWHQTAMPVKYANFVQIQPIAPDKRLRPKASNLIVISIELLL